jgi:predicted outer membrane protein
MSKKILIAALSIGLAPVAFAADNTTPAMNNNGNNNQLSQAGADLQPANKTEEENYVKAQASTNLFEGKLFDLIGSKTENKQVKEYAQTAAADHAQGKAALDALAQKLGVNLPQDELLPPQKAELDFLSQLNGQELNVAYIFSQVADHQKVLLWDHYFATRAESDDVKQFAEKNEHVIRHHLHMAQEIADSFAGIDRTAERNREGNEATEAGNRQEPNNNTGNMNR